MYLLVRSAVFTSKIFQAPKIRQSEAYLVPRRIDRLSSQATDSVQAGGAVGISRTSYTDFSFGVSLPHNRTRIGNASSLFRESCVSGGGPSELIIVFNPAFQMEWLFCRPFRYAGHQADIEVVKNIFAGTVTDPDRFVFANERHKKRPNGFCGISAYPLPLH